MFRFLFLFYVVCRIKSGDYNICEIPFMRLCGNLPGAAFMRLCGNPPRAELRGGCRQ